MGQLLRMLLAVCMLCGGFAAAGAQVFTVGEKTATADMQTDFKATHVELPQTPMTERGRRELIRGFEAEQGFAHRVLPLAGQLTLTANGNLTPGPDAYKMMVYKKGQAAAPGDRVAVTALEVKNDRIIVDLNGGPYVPHRFLRHIQIGVGGATTPTPDLTEQATGCRITVLFEGGTPEVSAPELKALLEPLVDFGVKTGEKAYADTLPAEVKSAIDSHDVVVGMNRRMVLASLGQPENKLRETEDGKRYEEWIYGHQPQTVKFVRFEGDRVSQVKVAAVGKAIELHKEEELAGILPAVPEKTVAVGDVVQTGEKAAALPTLMKAGETQELPEGTTERKVQMPDAKPAPKPAAAPQWAPSPAS